MKPWLRKSRRLIVAGSVVFAVAASSLACMGGTPTDVVTPAPSPAPAPTPAPTPAPSANKMLGNWRIVPPESELRNLKVINAAIGGKPQQKERLGTMTADEQAVFNEWKAKKGPEVEAMRAQLKFLKNCHFEFTDTQVTVIFEDEKFGPVSYTTVSSTDANTTVKFDPGLGNGTETHSIDWKGDGKGTDNISTASGGTFFPLDVLKQ
jgi:hypothetical protein